MQQKESFQSAAIPTLKPLLQQGFGKAIRFSVFFLNTQNRNETAYSVSPFLRAICVDL